MRLASTLGLAVSCAVLAFVACSEGSGESSGPGAGGEAGGANPEPGQGGDDSMAEAGAASMTGDAGAAHGGATGAEAGAAAGGEPGAEPPGPAPELSDFDPQMGLPGEVVTIHGDHFATDPADNEVTIGSVAAEVLAAGATTLTVEIPVGAETGKISVTSHGQLVTSEEDFEVLKDVPRDGLVAFYPMNGSAEDASGNSLHGTVSGATLVEDRFGGANKAYSFDGVDDLINMGNPAALQLDTAITLAAWVKASAWVDGRTLLSKIDDDLTAGYRFEMSMLGNGSRGYTVTVHSDGTGLNFARLSGDFVADQWTLLVFALDGNSMRFDQGDGTVFEVGNHRSLTSGALGDFKLGSSSPTGAYFAGVIDDVAIYDRKLSDAEIAQLYEQTVSKR